MKPDVILILVVPVTLEEAVVDWLLEHAPERGFTSSLAYGHSENLEDMSLSEQVTGRRRRVRFEVVCPHMDGVRHVESLKGAFQGTGIHYWLMPVVEAGRI